MPSGEPDEDVWLSGEEYGRYLGLWDDAMGWHERMVEIIQKRHDFSLRMGDPDSIRETQAMLEAAIKSRDRHLAAFEVIRESKDRP